MALQSIFIKIFFLLTVYYKINDITKKISKGGSSIKILFCTSIGNLYNSSSYMSNLYYSRVYMYLYIINKFEIQKCYEIRLNIFT